MKQTKRLMSLAAAVLVAISSWAQTMTFTYAGGKTATASEMADGSWLMQLPAGTDLNSAITGVKVNGTAVDAASVVPNPTETFITDGEIETFVYDGKAYSFRFLAGQYFTVVMFGDPHVAEGSGISVADMQTMATNIINMNKEGGKAVIFANAPKGYVPTTDLVICLGDMDKDNEESGTNFTNAMKGFNDAQIPFITITGNHDLVPDIYWDSTNDYGLSYSGCANNKTALNLVKTQYQKAAGFGGFTVETITDPN
ncbi:MAG: metallophosphoesterase, partial [Bacteroidaceae bacterium]|nr:metallophosphoesterase [Bacteroidaceae bacterium]